MKTFKTLPLILLILFISSCRQSFLSSRYNHLDKIERTSTNTLEKKTIASRPLIKKDSTINSIKIAAISIVQDTISELTASTENAISFSVKPTLKPLEKIVNTSELMKSKINCKTKERLGNKKKAYIYLISGFIALCIATVFTANFVVLLTFPIILLLLCGISFLIAGIIFYRKAEKSTLLKAVFTLILIATFALVCLGLLYIFLSNIGMDSNLDPF
jgi:hypothetical protein